MFKGFILATVMAGSSAVLLTACGGNVPTSTMRDRAGLHYATTTELVSSSGAGPGPAVVAKLIVTNTADTTQRLLWSDCHLGGPIRLRAYQPSDPTKPVWDSNAAYQTLVCDIVLHYRDVSPGASWQYVFPVPVQDILGDSLQTGVYSFTVYAGQLQPAHPVALPAGELTLTR